FFGFFAPALVFLSLPGLRRVIRERDPRILLLVGGAILILIRLYDERPFAFLFQVPLLRRVNFRYGFVLTGLAASILCGLGIQELINDLKRSLRWTIKAWAVFSASLLALIATIAWPVRADIPLGTIRPFLPLVFWVCWAA